MQLSQTILSTLLLNLVVAAPTQSAYDEEFTPESLAPHIAREIVDKSPAIEVNTIDKVGKVPISHVERHISSDSCPDLLKFIERNGNPILLLSKLNDTFANWADHPNDVSITIEHPPFHGQDIFARPSNKIFFFAEFDVKSVRFVGNFGYGDFNEIIDGETYHNTTPPHEIPPCPWHLPPHDEEEDLDEAKESPSKKTSSAKKKHHGKDKKHHNKDKKKHGKPCDHEESSSHMRHHDKKKDEEYEEHPIKHHGNKKEDRKESSSSSMKHHNNKNDIDHELFDDFDENQKDKKPHHDDDEDDHDDPDIGDVIEVPISRTFFEILKVWFNYY
ncbi:uncharacterized protein PWA37_003960 [Arxiozyma heterogenica]|uniref:uncharacterized protein n=1 Tax=Arxiozyma heterogenica TaxID=278026 RepID=UPI002F15DB9C